MGWIVHHAIIVTSYRKLDIDRAYEQAQAIFPAVSPPIESTVNGYWSFLSPPDGSKEGWPSSDEGDEERQRFAQWVADESASLTVVEVAYGEIEQPVIVRVDGKDTQKQYKGI
jgi:hypothetical protein